MKAFQVTLVIMRDGVRETVILTVVARSSITALQIAMRHFPAKTLVHSVAVEALS